MNLTPEQFAATRKALRAYDPKGTENLTDEHLDGMALSVALAIVTSAPDQGSGGVKKLPTDEMVKIGAEVLRNWWADPLNVLARKAWEAMEAARPKALEQPTDRNDRGIPDSQWAWKSDTANDDLKLLRWIRDRLVHVHGDHPGADFIYALQRLIDKTVKERAVEDQTRRVMVEQAKRFDPQVTGAPAARAHERAKGGPDHRWPLEAQKTYPASEKGVPVLDPINAEKPKPRTVDEMREAMKKATMDAALQSLLPGESVRVHKDKNGEFFINEGQPAA